VIGPNALTVLRILLAPAVGASILFGSDWQTIVLLGVALATDFFDGWWARRSGRASAMGRILDPLADKILAAATLIALALAERVPRELVFAVVLRDIVLLAFGWLRLRSGRHVPSAELPGKVGFGILGGYLVGIVLGVPWPDWAPGFVGVVYVAGGLAYAKRIPGLPVTRAAKGER
jgi:CDP-diacylglycerol--glycerol-3-phosphate 3-phosphatidyltransferase